MQGFLKANKQHRSSVPRLLLLVAVLIFTAISGDVYGKTTSDPNHKGYTGKHPNARQVTWKPIKTKCEHCVKITEQYNQTVQELLNSRYWVSFWRQIQKSRDAGKAEPFWQGKGDISNFESRAAAANLELFENQSAQLELHKKRVFFLEQQAAYLAQAIRVCEQTACTVKKPTKFKAISIGGVKAETFQPDTQGILREYGINWQGPYRTKCQPCLTYVTQLNALPGWVERAHMRLQRLETLLEYSKLIDKSNKVSVDYLKYSHPDKTDYSQVPQQLATVKAELAALKALFEKLVKQLSECERKFCKAIDDETALHVPAGESYPISTCPEPAAHEAINVGTNSDVGSSANFKEKAKKKVTGLATKAITGLLGIGGGGGGKSQGPATYKDPVKNKQKLKVRNKEQKREIRVGGVFTPDGLLISTDIKKAPGKGTFQTVYLENPRGWRLLPVRLLMYEIWRDWKLSVSWTRDTYVDGELVKHEEGGWTESWRELIARGEQIEYAEVPIWEQLGFNTAVSGARSLGTLFDVSPAMLLAEPINLVIHITDPKKDPVLTVPYLFQVSLNSKGQVVIEQVDQTLASEGDPCSEDSNRKPVVTPSNPQTPDVSVPSYEDTLDPQNCPDGWECREGQSCPPVDNCTLPSTGIPISNTTDDIEDLEDIEEIVVTGSRIRRTLPPLPNPETAPPSSTTTPPSASSIDDEGVEEIEVTGSRIKTETSTDTAITSTTESKTGSTTYGDLTSGYEVKLGADLQYNSGLEYGSETPPITYGEEIEEPDEVGIVLKNFDTWFIPRHDRYTFVTAKMYVRDPARPNVWLPDNNVKRAMEITFIARSNEKGKAMNADLDEGPQDSPDLYFAASRNFGAECRDDPTGKGHFGTCKTTGAHNEYQFTINSDDFGGFSRLDVSCADCVQLTPVAGVFPEAFTRGQRWEVAVEEPDREKRAVYVPVDNNRNQISDGYLPDKTGARAATEDNENAPVGNGVKGDGLSAYEEYRGFINRYGNHERTDWDNKTLMIENTHQLNTSTFASATGLEVVQLEITGHKNRIVNFNSGHANLVDQHGLILRMFPSLDDRFAGYCFCDLERPKGAERVTVKPASRHSDTVAHELGHAVGMRHHGDLPWPKEEQIRAMTSSIKDLLPGRVHTGPMLCGKRLPATFSIGTKGDQGSGNHQCYMKYAHFNYVYEQSGGDYDCMPATPRSIFDNSAQGTGPNGFNRTAGNATVGNCLSQIWINSK